MGVQHYPVGPIAHLHLRHLTAGSLEVIDRQSPTERVSAADEYDEALRQLVVVGTLRQFVHIQRRLVVAKPSPQTWLRIDLHLDIVHAPTFTRVHVHANPMARRRRLHDLLGIQILDMPHLNAKRRLDHLATDRLLQHDPIEHPPIRETQPSLLHVAPFAATNDKRSIQPPNRILVAETTAQKPHTNRPRATSQPLTNRPRSTPKPPNSHYQFAPAQPCVGSFPALASCLPSFR